jgi:hypothetical protein
MGVAPKLYRSQPLVREGPMASKTVKEKISEKRSGASWEEGMWRRRTASGG